MTLRLRFARNRVSLLPRVAFAILLLLAALGPVGCKLFESTCSENDRNCLGGGELRSGKVCIRDGDCAVGLECTKNVCVYSGTTKRGAACIVSAECADGLYCSLIDLTCRPLSDKPQATGGVCSSSADCQRGLVCDADLEELLTEGPFGLLPEECVEAVNDDETPETCELPRTCTPRGKQDLAGFCSRSADCLPGLFCIPDPLDLRKSVCAGGTKLSEEPISVPLWGGAPCPKDDDAARAYFDVPRDGTADTDFYRLPFPNDIRRTDSGLDLSGHPSPASDLAPQAAQRFLQESEKLKGFSTNPVVVFRFSKALRVSDLSGTTLRIVDITDNSPEYGNRASVAWGPSERRSNYVCTHWLGIHRPADSPLRSNTTYAAIITKGVHTNTGSDFARSPDLDAMLGSDRPSQAKLAAAWEKYAPLRAYLSGSKADLSAGEVLNATVFTTQDASGIVQKLRAAIEADGVPTLKDLTVCKDEVRSPCEDDTGRGLCHSERSTFTEIHGKVSLPIFQRGTPPYDTPELGGDIAVSSDGSPQIQDHQDVCFALSVPKKTAPSGGFPVLIVGHATGGSFSEQMTAAGYAQWAATLPMPAAVLSIDLPEHGNRRGSSKRPPQDLYFNLLNPKSVNGNALQGAADLISLALLVTKPIERSTSPTGQAIPFDKSRVALYAHSQGASHGALMIGSEPRIRAAVLSGVGGNFTTTLLHRKKPVDTSTVLPFLLFDPNTEGKLVATDSNPMLALLQGYLDSSDPINYAHELQLSPPTSATNGHDVFYVYGLFDSFAPEESQKAYAEAAALVAVDPDLSFSFNEIPSPAQGNVMPGGVARTVALRTYDPRADVIDDRVPQDGHFVASSTTRGLADVRRFLSQALQGQTPQIGQ